MESPRFLHLGRHACQSVKGAIHMGLGSPHQELIGFSAFGIKRHLRGRVRTRVIRTSALDRGDLRPAGIFPWTDYDDGHPDPWA